jgi:hypothetical protein
MIRIDSNHNGPPDSGHGGVTAGRIAELIDAARAAVRLHAPIPLETPMIPAHQPDGRIEVRAGASLVATARPLDHRLDIAGFEPLPDELVARAEQAWSRQHGGSHPFPTCFGCGPDRPAGDGLRLRPGPVAGHGLHATRWLPGCSGEVPPWLVWAALDCASAGAAMEATASGEVVVTGELAVEIRHPLDGGATWALVSRRARQSGRKVITETALVDAGGSPWAVAVATWFRIARQEAA